MYCADVPDLYVQDKSCPVAWQQRWQQSEVRIVLRANRAMEHGFRAGLLEDARRISLYKQLSNRKWPDRTRWREREPGFNYRDTELPRMLGENDRSGLRLKCQSRSYIRQHWPLATSSTSAIGGNPTFSIYR